MMHQGSDLHFARSFVPLNSSDLSRHQIWTGTEQAMNHSGKIYLFPAMTTFGLIELQGQ